MFLTTPTIAELKILDCAELFEMLVQQTREYIQAVNEEGFTQRATATKEFLSNIQSAIEQKQNDEKSAHGQDAVVISMNGQNEQRQKIS